MRVCFEFHARALFQRGIGACIYERISCDVVICSDFAWIYSDPVETLPTLFQPCNDLFCLLNCLRSLFSHCRPNFQKLVIIWRFVSNLDDFLKISIRSHDHNLFCILKLLNTQIIDFSCIFVYLNTSQAGYFTSLTGQEKQYFNVFLIGMNMIIITYKTARTYFGSKK